MEVKVPCVVYDKCCCFPSGECGPFKNRVDEMYSVSQLGDLDIKSHLVSLKVKIVSYIKLYPLGADYVSPLYPSVWMDWYIPPLLYNVLLYL